MRIIKSKKRLRIVLLRSILNFTIIFSAVFLLASFGPYLYYEALYHIEIWRGNSYIGRTTYASNINSNSKSSIQNTVIGPATSDLNPVSTQFGIVIPKLGINEKIVDGINPNSNAEVESGLKNGVGHAAGTSYPNPNRGNVYLFAHSSGDILDIPLYNAVFTLLRELNPGDVVIIFYQGKRYNYIVYSKEVLPQDNTNYLTSLAAQPTLTLQTCDPPGLNINRLFVRAHLASINNN